MFNVKTTHNGKKSVWKLGEEFRQTWRNNCLLVRGILVLFLEKLLSTVMSVSWMMPLLKYHREGITEDRARARQFWIWKVTDDWSRHNQIRGSHRLGAKRRKLASGFTGLTPRFSGRWAQGCTRRGWWKACTGNRETTAGFPCSNNQITVPPQILM